MIVFSRHGRIITRSQSGSFVDLPGFSRSEQIVGRKLRDYRSQQQRRKDAAKHALKIQPYQEGLFSRAGRGHMKLKRSSHLCAGLRKEQQSSKNNGQLGRRGGDASEDRKFWIYGGPRKCKIESEEARTASNTSPGKSGGPGSQSVGHQESPVEGDTGAHTLGRLTK